MELGRKVFYDKLTGNHIFTICEFSGPVIATTIEQDVLIHPILSERSRESFDVIELPYGAYRQEFNETIPYRVDLETKKLVFQYPNENEPEVEQPFIFPLSDEISLLKDENAILFYDSMMKDAKIAELEEAQSVMSQELVIKETAHADLMYTLMMNGVI